MLTYDLTERGGAPIYEYLYRCLRRDILSGALVVGERLPSKRALAEHLGVEIPMTKIVKEQMDWMDAHGMIDEDQCALVKYYEDTMSVEVK